MLFYKGGCVCVYVCLYITPAPPNQAIAVLDCPAAAYCGY